MRQNSGENFLEQQFWLYLYGVMVALMVHLVSSPKKAKLSPGPMRIHLQNLRFSLVAGLPPTLVHTWDLVDLRSVKTFGYGEDLTPFYIL